MSKRAQYPSGVPCWVETLQPDPRAALEFYGPLFGWEFSDPGPLAGDLPGEYFVAQLDGRDVAGIGSLPDGGGPPVAVWNTHIRVDSADAAAERAQAAGAALLAGPLDALPAGRFAVVVDPAGAAISVWEARAREGAQVVNEPGTWMMSSLHVTDLETASAFYRSVFGWEPEAFGPLTLWRLAGYGGEAQGQLPPDVVAVMAPRDDAVPPHWNVNLRVDDADATAALATSLGGAVLAPVFDTPGFRNAILADAQGAVFSISQLTARP
jgi:predicted enzyme related to lactoylglutathione lyase